GLSHRSRVLCGILSLQNRSDKVGNLPSMAKKWPSQVKRLVVLHPGLCFADGAATRSLLLPRTWLLRRCSANAVACFQRIANCIAGLFEALLNSCNIMDGVQEHEVVDQSVVTSRRHRDTGLPEVACIRFSLVAQRIILRSDNKRGWQALKFGIACSQRRYVW